MIVSFICHLEELKDAQITCKEFLGVSVRMFLEGVSI